MKKTKHLNITINSGLITINSGLITINKMVIKDTNKKLSLLLLKDFSKVHTITSIAKQLDMSRVGTWKTLKQLQSVNFIKLSTIGSGKTSTSTINLNWENLIVEKLLALYLTEEALKQRRWRINFADLEKLVDFMILFGSVLYSPKEAKDIDIVIVSQRRKFIKIQKILDKTQKSQIKRIHNINFTEGEFEEELKKPNKALLDAIKKGVILFGQEKFIQFMERIVKK